jgi:hypothetical protein
MLTIHLQFLVAEYLSYCMEATAVHEE